MGSFRLSLLAGLLTPACGSCFSGQTLVSRREGETPISRIRAGDLVLSFDPKRQTLVERRVTRVFRHSPRPTGTFRHAGLAGVTGNHPIYDCESRTFVAAASVHAKHRLLRLQGGALRPSDEEFLFQSKNVVEPVYNFSVEETETYFAGGILVHNKTEPLPGDGACLISPAYTSGCEELEVEYYDSPVQVLSAEALCTQSQDGMGGMGGIPVSGLDQDEVVRKYFTESELNALRCTSSIEPPSRDAWLLIYESETPTCLRMNLRVTGVTGPVSVEIFDRGTQPCEFVGEPLLEQTVDETTEIPLPDQHGPFTLRIQPLSNEPLWAEVDLIEVR